MPAHDYVDIDCADYDYDENNDLSDAASIVSESSSGFHFP